MKEKYQRITRKGDAYFMLTSLHILDNDMFVNSANLVIERFGHQFKHGFQ